MAGRILNRRELRKQADQAEEQGGEVEVEEKGVEEGAAVKKAGKGKAKAKVKAPAKPRKPRKKKAPARMCARWGVFDNGMKQVAIFDFNQRELAEKKAADLRAQMNTPNYFLQIVKEPMPEPEPLEVEPA
jgi:hypothetical protein